jgi:hypothetical protein
MDDTCRSNGQPTLGLCHLDILLRFGIFPALTKVNE